MKIKAASLLGRLSAQMLAESRTSGCSTGPWSTQLLRFAAAAQPQPVNQDDFESFVRVPPARLDKSKPVPRRSDQPPLDFTNPQASFTHMSNFELARSYLVLKLCSFKGLVKNSNMLLNAANSVVGPRLVERIVKETFFAQFCAGEDEASIQPTIQMLRANGVGKHTLLGLHASCRFPLVKTGLESGCQPMHSVV